MKTTLLKLTPHPVFKPWGLVHRALKNATAISIGIGELWLASAQKGEGNAANTIYGVPGGGNLADLLQEAEDNSELEKWLGARPARKHKETDYRGKTEAWLVREACGFAGFAAGPDDELKKQRLKELLTGPGLPPDVRQWSEEVRDLFHLVTPLQKGDSFLVPAGTLHTMFALGEGSRLIVDEIQQGYGSGLLPTLAKTLMVEDSLLSVQVHPDDETVRKTATGQMRIAQDLQTNPTVRVYDFGRRPGEYPELGFKLTDVSKGLRKVPPVEVMLPGCTLKFLIACPQFVMSRLELPAGGKADSGSLPVFDSYHVLHCTSGEAEVRSGKEKIRIAAGETAFVPGMLEPGMAISSRDGVQLLDHAVPAMDILRQWRCGHDVGESAFKALLDPPRA